MTKTGQNGTRIDAGFGPIEAVPPETDGLLWIYVTTTNLMGTPGLQLDANAYDLPGNVGATSISLN